MSDILMDRAVVLDLVISSTNDAPSVGLGYFQLLANQYDQILYETVGMSGIAKKLQSFDGKQFVTVPSEVNLALRSARSGSSGIYSIH
jgi:hypothetical protein